MHQDRLNSHILLALTTIVVKDQACGLVDVRDVEQVVFGACGGDASITPFPAKRQDSAYHFQEVAGPSRVTRADVACCASLSDANGNSAIRAR